MTLSETEKYIKGTIEKIGDSIYQPLQKIDRVKCRRLDYNQRKYVLESTENWEEFDCSGTWGGRDYHICFAFTVRIPENAAGEEIVVRLATGATDIWNTDNPQFIAYVNGDMVCALDMNHQCIPLTKYAEGGENVDVRLYAYANTGRKNLFLDLTVNIFHRRIEETYYDLKVPMDAACLMRDEEDEKRRIFHILKTAAAQIDFRQGFASDHYRESLEKAGKYLKESLEATPGENPVQVYSVGHTHIDIAWKWPIRQTREKALRSFLTVLYLMDEYPDYIFMSSQPQLYAYVKEECPEIYEKIKEKIKEKRWEPEGGMWVEADCNISSGESLIRQIFYGKKFFAEEFGQGDNVVLWLPDVFGYSAALPQIMKKTGLKYFMTTKLGWNEKNKFPYDTMIWEGIDGSEILAYFITTRNYCTYPELIRQEAINTTYNGMENASQIMGTWQRYQNKEISSRVLTCYGYGDGGGGSTRKMLEEGKRLAKGIPGVPKVRFSGVKKFFTDLEKELDGKKVPKWCGELYLEFHRGTYTSMAENKKSNRFCEFLLQFTENLAVYAEDTGRSFYPEKELEKAWKLLLTNQFHDILPGSSIGEVYAQSAQEYEKICDICEKIQKDSIYALGEDLGMSWCGAEECDAVSVWNPLSFPSDCCIQLPGKEWITGNAEDFYHTFEGNTVIYARNVPGKGFKRISLKKSKEETKAEYKSETGDRVSLHTPYYKAEILADGKIERLYDVENNREIFDKKMPGNYIRIFDDRPYEYDAWNIDESYRINSWDPEPAGDICLIEESMRWVVKLQLRYLQSEIEQEIIFYRDSRRIDFKTKIHWNQHQQLVKAEFPFQIMSRKITSDIQYGNVERATHKNTTWEQAKFEMCMHKWIDFSERGYGVAILNDSKYGYSAEESVISLTLLKSGIFPNPEADIGTHSFVYSLFPHKGDFREGKVIQEAYRLNCRPYFWTGKADSNKTDEKYGIWINRENIFAEVVKKADNRNGIIIRMYEAYGERTEVKWDYQGRKSEEVWECDMLENKEKLESVSSEGISSIFLPYEIKTFLIR